jgi:Bacterial Ig domain
VFSGDSSGTTASSEKYIIPSTDARYVRVTINGNTQNNAASIYELDIFGSSSSANSPPVANNQAVTTSKNIAKDITLTASDPNNDPRNYSIVTQPAHGTLTGSKPNLNYNPDTYLKFDINKIKVEYESDLNKIERNMSEKHIQIHIHNQSKLLFKIPNIIS